MSYIQEDNMKLLKFLKIYEYAMLASGGKFVGKVIVIIFMMGFSISFVTDVHAACDATINGRPMTAEECDVATRIYGYVEPGDYLRDSRGNWVKVGDPYKRGNVYLDAQRQGDSGDSGYWSDGEGLTRTPFGSVGGGYYLDH